MKAIELSKQQVLDANLKAILQINITGNLDQAGYFFFLGGGGVHKELLEYCRTT